MPTTNFNLQEQREFARESFPLLVPHIERIMRLARERYKQAGQPLGDTEQAAYTWWSQNFQAWRGKQALSEIDSQARELVQEKITAAVEAGLVEQVDTDTIKYTPLGVIQYIALELSGYIHMSTDRELNVYDLIALQATLARGALSLEEYIHAHGPVGADASTHPTQDH